MDVCPDLNGHVRVLHVDVVFEVAIDTDDDDDDDDYHYCYCDDDHGV